MGKAPASAMFRGLAGVGVEGFLSCEVTDVALLLHAEKPVDGDAMAGGVRVCQASRNRVRSA